MRLKYDPQLAEKLFQEVSSEFARQNFDKSIANKSFVARKQFLKYFHDTHKEAARAPLFPFQAEFTNNNNNNNNYIFDFESDATNRDLNNRLFYLYNFFNLYLKAEFSSDSRKIFNKYFGDIKDYSNEDINKLTSEIQMLISRNKNFEISLGISEKRKSFTDNSEISLPVQSDSPSLSHFDNNFHDSQVDDDMDINNLPNVVPEADTENNNQQQQNSTEQETKPSFARQMLFALSENIQNISPRKELYKGEDNKIIMVSPLRHLESTMVSLGEALQEGKITDEYAFLNLFSKLQQYNKWMDSLDIDSKISPAIDAILNNADFLAYNNALLQLIKQNSTPSDTKASSQAVNRNTIFSRNNSNVSQPNENKPQAKSKTPNPFK